MTFRSAAISLVLAGAVLVAPVAAETQRSDRLYRVGFLHLDSAGLAWGALSALQDELRSLGYVEGRNLVLRYGWADGVVERYPALATDLINSGVDVITAPCGSAVSAVRSAGRMTPLVVRCVSLKTLGTEVAALDRPGGHTTGVLVATPAAFGERLRILREAIPHLRRVAVLHSAESDWAPLWSDLQATASRAAVTLVPMSVRGPADLAGAFEAAAAQRVDALVTLADDMINSNRATVFRLAERHRVPALYDFGMGWRHHGLMSYAARTSELFRRVARQIDRILRGESPGSIPIERPTTFELVVNPDSAKVIGLTLPPSLLRRADRVLYHLVID